MFCICLSFRFIVICQLWTISIIFFISEAGAAATTPPILPQVDQPAGLDSVISRTHMNDEQRDIKQKFEEKQRDIARKSAHKNKLTQKKVSYVV